MAVPTHPRAVAGNELGESAIARSNRLLLETGKLPYEIGRSVRSFESNYEQLRSSLSEAWRERRDLLDFCFEMARDLSDLRDDSSAGALDAAAIAARLGRILTDRGIEYLEVECPAPFDPAIHECGDLRTEPGAQPGFVVAVLAPGLTIRSGNGARTVIRPARVVVNGTPDTAQEKGNDE